MRVTHSLLVESSLRRLSTRLESYERAYSRAATGRQTLAPSDDPAGTGRSLSLRAERTSLEQQVRNADEGASWLGNADTVLQNGLDRLRRARDLAVQGANPLGADEREAVAAEVEAIRDELVAIANSTHRGRPLFGGFADGPAVRGEWNAVTGEWNGPWAFHDDGQALTRRVGSTEVVDITVTARDTFWADPADPDSSVFAALDALAVDLRDGNAAGIAAGIDAIDTARSTVNGSLVKIGTATSRLESARMRAEDSLVRIRTELSAVEDVDLAEAIMDMRTQEVSYTATLQALAKALPQSLVSFLA